MELHTKIPPQDIDIEKAVLGAILLEKGAIDEVASILTSEMFYSGQNAEVYNACLELMNQSKPIDILTVTQTLRKNNKLKMVGGAVYVSELTQRVGSSANIEMHARLLIEKWSLRETIKNCDITIKEAYSDSADAFEVVDALESKLMALNGKIVSGKDTEHISAVLKENVTQIEKAVANKGVTGVPTGLKELDDIIGGFNPGDLVIIGARPSMGKTALLLTLATNAAEKGYPIGIFSLEMASTQLTNRAIAKVTGLENRRIYRGDYHPDELFKKVNEAVATLSTMPIYIDETPGLSITQFRAKAKKLVSKHGVKAIFIDYLQLMTANLGKGSNREAEISHISRSLKIVAKDLGVPVIALSQLSRKVDERGDKRPNLSDLRESGAIEQDADMVCFIYRPSYYGIDKDLEGNFISSDYAEIMVEKNRNGACNIAKLVYKEEQTLFTSTYSQENTLPPFGNLKQNSNFDKEQPF